jgi:hypothetical protein
MPSLEQIHESIEARLGELRSEMTSLEAARAALHTNGASRARPKPTGAGAATKPKRRRSSASEGSATAAQSDATTAVAAAAPAPATREPSTKPVARSRTPRTPARRRPAKPKPVAVLLAGKLEAMLREAGNGLNAVAIAKQANARATQVRDLLRELEGAGQVRRTGVGRASRWTLVTDEERIAERAAELAARSTPKP